MITKIYSKVNPSLILNVIYSNDKDYVSNKEAKREELTESTSFLQAMSLKFPTGHIIKPHKHNISEKRTSKTQEAILVFKGLIELSIYDIDNKIIETRQLKEGDCTVIIDGGHSIKTLADSHLFEFKNGPYLGSDKDRTNIN